MRLAWAATDAGTGVVGVEVQERVDGGAWSAVSGGMPAAGQVRHLAPAGSTFAWRYRATDANGNVSGWRETRTYTAARREESAVQVSWRGAWTTRWNAVFSAGRARSTRSAGARATFAFTGRSVAWVGRTGPGGGSAQIRVDGVLVATVSSRSSTTAHRVVRWVGQVPAGPHRIEIRAVGDGRIDVDAFLVLR
jgi:hypothetical protein